MATQSIEESIEQAPTQPRPPEPVAQSERPSVPVIVIQPTRGWGSLELGELWRYRELIWFLTTRDIKGRYRQMALGWLWIVLKPLVDMVVFSLVFGGLARLPSDGLPYPIFTYTAILPWAFFATAASGSAGSLINRMNVISKVYFPRLVVPISAVLASLADLAMSFVILLGMLAWYGFAPSWWALTLPLYLLLAGAVALGIGLWAATIAVRFRDLQFVVTYGTEVWKFATPVAYAASVALERLTPEWQVVYKLNPMFWVIEGFRWALLGKGTPPEPLMVVPVLLSLLFLVSGAYVFRRTERTVVDLL